MDLALLLQVLPLAIGAAISPTVLTIQILLMSGGTGGLAKAWGLAVGRTAALIAITVGGVGLLSRLPDVNTGQPSLSEGLIVLGAGLVLALVALKEWRAPRSTDHHSRIVARLRRIHPVLLVFVGFGWELVSVSTLALFLPALHLISNAAAPDVIKLVAVIELIAIASITWLGPPLAVTFYGERAREVLDRIHTWVSAHEHQITLIATSVFGVALLLWGGVVTAQNWP